MYWTGRVNTSCQYVKVITRIGWFITFCTSFDIMDMLKQPYIEKAFFSFIPYFVTFQQMTTRGGWLKKKWKNVTWGGNVRIRSFLVRIFPHLDGTRNTIYSLNLRFQPECGKTLTRKNPNTGTFYSMNISLVLVKITVAKI